MYGNAKNLKKLKHVSKRDKDDEYTLFDLMTYYEATIIKTVLKWSQDRHVHGWNRVYK